MIEISLGTDTNLEVEKYRSMSVSTATDNTSTSKRVFLRLRSSAAPKETEIIDTFLSNSCCSGIENDQHYMHYEPPQSSHFHIIIDMDYTQIINPNLVQLPDEVYKVSVKEGSSKAVSLSERINLASNQS
jgi:hypothetical protein